MSLGEKILELRKKKGLSQEELGNRIKVTRQTISNWELNETSPNPEQLKALSKELNVSIDELLDNDVNNILVEKITNTEKLSETVLKIMKIILYIVIGIVILWFVLIIGRIIVRNIQDRGKKINESIVCQLYGESHSYGISYYDHDFIPREQGGDSYFDDILDLSKYDNANQIFNIINDYVKKNGGTCARFMEHDLEDILTIYVKDKTSTGGTVVIEEYDQDYDIYYGEPFTIEKFNYNNNQWDELEITCDGCGFNDIGYTATPDKPLEMYQDWSKLYGELPKGLYRIVKDANFVTTGEQYKIWGEFLID